MTIPTTERLDAATLLGLYEQMAVIRRTEKAAFDLFMAGKVKGTTHLASGHEAVAVGASAALEPDDYVFATYRGHHHAMARGATPAECLAELMSKATGVCKAKGGSMHLTKASAGMLGSYAIVGAHLPMAVGAAWSARLRGTRQVAVAFFGDGATNIGAFHEALNLAAVWRLPVVFVCENNLYMEYTPIASVTSAENPAADRAAAHRMPASVIDGNDVEVVHAEVLDGRTTGAGGGRADDGRGPDLPALRAQPHRPRRSTAPPTRSRSGWPATRCSSPRSRLGDLGVGEDELARVDERVERTVLDAVREADEAPGADPAEALTDVWADGGSAWRT